MMDCWLRHVLIGIANFGWDALTKVGVPLLAALLAGAVIAIQIRADHRDVERQLEVAQTDRLEQRRALGLQTASNLFIRDSEIPFELKSNPTLEFMKSNRDVIAVYSYLIGPDLPVAMWVAAQHAVHIKMIEAWVANVTPDTDFDVVGERSAVAREAAMALEKIMSWYQKDGKHPTQWFVDNKPTSS
ncbi:protein of unknown function [Agreia sp. COWG]|nr:protein of unknown function [Agreia sp. COWG]